MSEEYVFETFEDEQDYDYRTNKNSYLTNDKFYLTEDNFYSSSDNRVWKSYIEDIDGGDNFADYCEYIFELLEEEGYYN